MLDYEHSCWIYFLHSKGSLALTGQFIILERWMNSNEWSFQEFQAVYWIFGIFWSLFVTLCLFRITPHSPLRSHRPFLFVCLLLWLTYSTSSDPFRMWEGVSSCRASDRSVPLHPPPRPPVPPEGGALIACADLTFACTALPEASAARQAYNTISTCVPVTLAGRPPKC